MIGSINKDTNITVAVLMATYNGEKYIHDQIESLLHQTYSQFTCYIHDDGSNDNTVSIIDEYTKQYPEKVKIIRGKSSGGAKENFIFLLQMVEADYYLFCDQDDIWEKTKVEQSLQTVQQMDQDEPICVYTDLKVINADRQIISDSFYRYTGLDPKCNTYKDFLIGNVCVGCTMIINRCLRDDMIRIACAPFLMHDQEVAAIASLKGKLLYLDEKTVLYRQHHDNAMGAKRNKSEIIRAIKEFCNNLSQRKKHLETHRKRAIELLKLDNLEREKKEFLYELTTLVRKNKIQRICFYYKNHLFRSTSKGIWEIVRVLGV